MTQQEIIEANLKAQEEAALNQFKRQARLEAIRLSMQVNPTAPITKAEEIYQFLTSNL